jgi:hypothetical protein
MRRGKFPARLSDERLSLLEDFPDARSLCEQLLARHHNNVDRGRATCSGRLFTSDALWTVPGGVARGTGEIATQSLLRFEAAFRCDDGAWRIAMLHLEALGGEGS